MPLALYNSRMQIQSDYKEFKLKGGKKMRRNRFTRENLNLKEVKLMKKLVGILIVSLVVVMGGMFSQASAQLVVGEENVLYFNNFEIIIEIE